MGAATGLIGLYWSARKAPLDQCSEHCFRALSCLREHGFSSFYRLGRTRKEALQRPFELSLGAVRQLLERGVNRTDVGREPIPELGYSLSLWSGGSDDDSYSVSVHCGGHSLHVGNNFLVRLPAGGISHPFSLLPIIPTFFCPIPNNLETPKAVGGGSFPPPWDHGRFGKGMKAYLRYPHDT